MTEVAQTVSKTVLGKALMGIFFAAIFMIALAGLLSIIKADSGEPEKIGFTDLAGRTVAVKGDVRRLIALGPGALRLVAYLEAEDMLVGIENMEFEMARDAYVRPYSMVLTDAIMRLPIVGPGGPGALPDPERIILSQPDVIVAVAIDPSNLNSLQARTGVPTAYLSYGQLGAWREDAMRSLLLLGEILGKTARAEELAQYIRSVENDLKRRTENIPEADRPSVYVGGVSLKGTQGITSTEAGYLPAQLAGARNVADTLESEGHFFIDREQLLAWNPEVMFIDTTSRPIVDADFAKDPEFFRLLNATSTGKTYSLLPYNYYNTNIELALLNAYFIGKTLYPERFRDVDIEEKTKEIMMNFLGVVPEDYAPAFHSLKFLESGTIVWK